MSKKKDSDILTDVVDVMGELLVKLFHLSVELVNFLLKRYVFEREWGEYREVKKIERRSLSKKTATLRDDAIGYSVTNRKLVYGHELDKSIHTAVIGASGSGKTVLLDALMFEDMRQGKPVVYIDPKGDIGTMNKFIRMCQFTGRGLFRFFGELPRRKELCLESGQRRVCFQYRRQNPADTPLHGARNTTPSFVGMPWGRHLSI